MKTDWARQRRNLVAVSVALAIFWGADGKLDESIVIGQGARLENPVTLVVVATFVWLYLLWRYWLYSKGYHREVGEAIDCRFRELDCYTELVDRHDVHFRNRSGVSRAEGLQKAAIKDEPDAEFKSIPTSLLVKRGLRRHRLTISVDNPKGEYHPDSQDFQIRSLTYEKCRLCAVLKTFMSDRIVSDIVIPYIVGTLPLLAWVLSQFFA